MGHKYVTHDVKSLKWQKLAAKNDSNLPSVSFRELKEVDPNLKMQSQRWLKVYDSWSMHILLSWFSIYKQIIIYLFKHARKTYTGNVQVKFCTLRFSNGKLLKHGPIINQPMRDDLDFYPILKPEIFHLNFQRKWKILQSDGIFLSAKNSNFLIFVNPYFQLSKVQSKFNRKMIFLFGLGQCIISNLEHGLQGFKIIMSHSKESKD